MMRYDISSDEHGKITSVRVYFDGGNAEIFGHVVTVKTVDDRPIIIDPHSRNDVTLRAPSLKDEPRR